MHFLQLSKKIMIFGKNTKEKSVVLGKRKRRKLSEGSEEVLDSIRAGYVSYVICTRAILSGIHYRDGVAIRRCAAQNGITGLKPPIGALSADADDTANGTA